MEIILKNFKPHPSRPSLTFDVEIPIDPHHSIELRDFTYFKRGENVDSPKARVPGLRTRIIEFPRAWLEKIAHIIPEEARKMPGGLGPLKIVIPVDRLQDQPMVAEAAAYSGTDLKKFFSKK